MRSYLPPTLALFGFLASLSPYAAGQGCVSQPDADPTIGTSSIHPFGNGDPNDLQATNQSIVFRVPAASLPNQRTEILEIGFCSPSDRLYRFESLSVRLGQSTSPNLTDILALNLVGFSATVMQVGEWSWSVRANEWTYLGLTTSYPYDPARGDLVVQITTAGAYSSGSGALGFRSEPLRPSVLQTGWRLQPNRGAIGTGAPKIRVCWDASDLQVFGGGCAGSNALVPRLGLSGDSSLGGIFHLTLSDVPPTSPYAFLIIDYRLRALPFDLTPYGATGCEVLPFWSLFFEPFGLVIGSADLPLGVPLDPSLRGGKAWCQWLPFDPTANSLHYTTSNVGRVLIGS